MHTNTYRTVCGEIYAVKDVVYFHILSIIDVFREPCPLLEL